MRVVIIGATGHVGTYLVPLLDEAGHKVVAVSRSRRSPYHEHPAFARAESVALERTDDDASFAAAIASLKPDVVIDMICFRPESMVALAEALRGSIAHLLACGTISIHGPGDAVPLAEEACRRPEGNYGIRKLAMTEYLEREARAGRLPATVVHPGHITGPGWLLINPAGNFNTTIFRTIAGGGRIRLPNCGMETLHHVHAEDIARLLLACIESWNASVGQSFHSVCEKALTLRGYAEAMYRSAGHEPAVDFLPFDEWKTGVDEKEANLTRMLLELSPCCSMEKARRLLGFVPRHGALQTVTEAAAWLAEHDYAAPM